MKCSIAIIEERELFRKGICRLLSSISWISVLYETGDVKEGFEILSKHQPGILLVDPFTNKRNHPDILKHIKSLSPTTCIVAVTDCDSPEEIAFARSFIAGLFNAVTSFAADIIVIDILVPVSPSGTGNTFNSLI